MADEIVSASLIRTMPRLLLSDEDKKFCLGLVGWCPCDDCQSDSVTKKLVEESVVTNGIRLVTKSLKLKHK